MTADVQVGLLVFQNVSHLGHIVPWIATDMGHVDIDVFHMEKEVFWVLQPNDVVVDVAVNRAQRLEVSQGLGSFDIADVARVPQLVDVLEEVEKLWHEGTMRVGQNADSQHVISD